MPGAHKSCSVTLSPELDRGEKKKKRDDKRLGSDKDREGSLTNYSHGQNTLNLGKLV